MDNRTETPEQRRARTNLNLRPPWKPGELPNPGGKPTKSRNRLQGNFFRELADDFEKHGKKAIVAAREDDPMGYIKTVASLMPKEFELARPLDEIPEEQLDAAIIAVRAIIAAQDSGNSQERITRNESPSGLPAVPETT